MCSAVVTSDRDDRWLGQGSSGVVERWTKRSVNPTAAFEAKGMIVKKTLLVIAAGALTLPVATPAVADPPPWAPAHGYRAKEANRIQYRTSGNGIRYWRGNDGRYYCKRSNGTTGLIIGAAAGALAGRAVDTRGERTTGTVLGAAAGALLGRQIERGSVRCR
jgi:hypothetical protein